MLSEGAGEEEEQEVEEEEDESLAEDSELWDEETSLMVSMGLPLAFASSSAQRQAVSLSLIQHCTHPL